MKARKTTRAAKAMILAASLVAVLARPAAAGEVKVGAVNIPYDPQALATEAGAQALLARLEAAAHDACGGDPRNHSSWKSTPRRAAQVFKACREQAVARAVAELGSPKLAAAHAGRVRQAAAR